MSVGVWERRACPEYISFDFVSGELCFREIGDSIYLIFRQYCVRGGVPRKRRIIAIDLAITEAYFRCYPSPAGEKYCITCNVQYP